MIDPSYKSLHLQMAEQVHALTDQYSDDINAFLHELAGAAVDCVPGAQYAGISVVRSRGQLHTAASSGTYPAVLDSLQQRYGQGPCLEAALRHCSVHVDDLRSDTRWPLYRRDSINQTPIRSSLSMSVLPDQYLTGALNVFAEQPRAFKAESFEIASIFAVHAALGWSTVRAKNQLRRAAATGDVTGQVKGILMERFNVTEDEALALLKRLSKDSRVSVSEISRRLAAKQFGEHMPATLPSKMIKAAKGSHRNRQEIRDAARC